MDEFEGVNSDPLAIHKYLFSHSDPLNRIDPSGTLSLTEITLITSLVLIPTTIAEFRPPGKRCGPDVTDSLHSTLLEISATYDSWSSQQKKEAADSMYRIIPSGRVWGPNAWDIEDLFLIGLSRGNISERTVMFEGRCYYGGAVNYAMWGLMNRLVYDTTRDARYSLDSALNQVAYWKFLKRFPQELGDEEEQAFAFTVFGYDGVLPHRGIPHLVLPTGKRTGNMNWVWEPIRPREE
jgi:hypothetical protein